MKITLIYKSYEEEVVNDNNERTMYHIIHDILPEKIDAFLKKHEIKECKINTNLVVIHEETLCFREAINRWKEMLK